MDREVKCAFLRYKLAKEQEKKNAKADIKNQYQLKIDEVEMELEGLREYYSFLNDTYHVG